MINTTPVAQKKYKNKMSRLGYRRVTVWIPKKSHKELMDIAEEMRDEHEEERRLKAAAKEDQTNCES